MVGLPIIESALAGFNTSLVCYGQVLLFTGPLIQEDALLFCAALFYSLLCCIMLMYVLNVEWNGEDIHHVGGPRCDG